MKPVFQTIFDAVKGNCLQASLASALEVSLDEVPNFMERDDDDWYGALNGWLRKNYGVQVVCVPAGDWVPPGIHLTGGMGARGLEHVVVGRDGAMIHDPHPKNGGLTEEKEHWLFVAVNPAILRRAE